MYQELVDFISDEWIKIIKESEHFSSYKDDEEKEKNLWNEISKRYDDGLGSDNLRVSRIIEILLNKKIIDSDTTALDIGSGTGAYAIGLSKICKKVYALDYSDGMLKVLKNKTEHISNIETVSFNWEKGNISDLKLEDEIDFSISSLNTGIMNKENLLKMNEITKKVCCYVTTAGLSKTKTNEDLEKLILGRKLVHKLGNDVVFPFCILYGMGFYPELEYVKSSWKREITPEEAIENIIKKYSLYKEINKDVKIKIERYVFENLNKNKLFLEKNSYKLGILTWFK